MKKFLLLFLACFVASLSAQDYFNTTTSPACIEDGSGALMAAGTITIIGTDQNDHPMPFRIGTAGQAITAPIVRSIVAGALSTSLQLANPANTSPTNIVYRISIQDNLSKKNTVYTKVNVFNNDSGNFNLCKANLVAGSLPGIPTLIGPTGLTGPANGWNSTQTVFGFDNTGKNATASLDTGFSWISTGVMGLDTSTPGNKLGTLKLALADFGTGLRLAGAAPTGHVPRGNGTNYVDGALASTDLSDTALLPYIAGSYSNTGLSAPIGTTNLTASATNSLYEVRWVASTINFCTNAGASAWTITLNYTDHNGTAKTVSFTAGTAPPGVSGWTTSSNLGASSIAQYENLNWTFWPQAATAVTFSTTYAGCTTGGPWTYDIKVALVKYPTP